MGMKWVWIVLAILLIGLAALYLLTSHQPPPQQNLSQPKHESPIVAENVVIIGRGRR